MTELIAVTGAAPGVGKTTACTGLRDWLAERDLRVDFVREEESMTRREFAGVITEFQTTGVARPKSLLAAMSDYVTSVQAARVDIAILDSLMPFIRFLRSWSHDEQANRLPGSRAGGDAAADNGPAVEGRRHRPGRRTPTR